MTPTPGVKALADAISKAEGFGIPGAVPTRAHNPGDLKIPGWTGPKTGTEGISVFSTDEEGWTHLYQQLIRIVNGASHVYTLDMTLQQFGDRWTDTQQGPWITNVIAELQVQGFAVDESSTLREVLT